MNKDTTLVSKTVFIFYRIFPVNLNYCHCNFRIFSTFVPIYHHFKIVIINNITSNDFDRPTRMGFQNIFLILSDHSPWMTLIYIYPLRR